jgi:DNA polymerase V
MICFCIDLKSFYASVECVERGLNPDTTDLVVADPSRSEKTICLAVSPSLKSKGVKNRCRLFQIPKTLKYITAPPRMQKYIDYSAEIYGIYLEFFSAEDIHVYSIDEVFIDATKYLTLYNLPAKDLAKKILKHIYLKLGLRASCGIGTNLYLAKIALDITAKHSDEHIGILDEESYKATLWNHKPLTDFWRIGKGCASRLEKRGILTMKDIACANEDLIYKLFGIDAELIIDHANGREPTTVADIKNYKSKSKCLTSSQVLSRDYSFNEALIIVKEMTDTLCIELACKKLLTTSLSLYVGYSNESNVVPVHSSASLKYATDSDKFIIPLIESIYKRSAHPTVPIRRIGITFNNVIPASSARQLQLFEDANDTDRRKRLQDAVIGIKHRYGKNTILKGMNLLESATQRERNQQIGGHKSG